MLLTYDRAKEVELVIGKLLCVEEYEMWATKEVTCTQAILSQNAYVTQSTEKDSSVCKTDLGRDSPSQHCPSPVP